MGAYNAQWSIFVRWCGRRGLDPFRADVTHILEFLNELFLQGKAYNTLKGYMSALSAFRGKIGGFSFVSHPNISTFLKGVLRRRPPVKKTVPCWDLEVVLAFLSSSQFEPPSRVSLSFWTLKRRSG